MMENYTNKLYNGNLYWVFEALKVVNKEIDFDKTFNETDSFSNNEILIFDCIVFNEDKEDSLFFYKEGTVYEYFSIDKCELILKLIKLFEKKDYYQNKNKNNINLNIGTSIFPSKLPTINNSFDKNSQKVNLNLLTKNQSSRRSSNGYIYLPHHHTKVSSSLSNLQTNIKANILLTYKDNSCKDYID
jgi:hypothetical protein